MSLPHLSLADARNLHLAAQGLLNKPRRRASLGDIPATISRMSLLQIDTINIVARSPYLVLFSRLGNYPAQWLDESLARGELMEYWAHEACFMPRSDFRLIRHRMLAPEKMGWKYKDAWMQEHAAEIAQLIQHIHDKGPVRSADFEHPRKGASGWWEWKPHKRHLEGLFTAGKVMVIERRNFQRVYDLTHRVMPDWDDERDLVSQTEAEIIMLDNSARSLGIFREQWLADYYRLKRPALAAWREARAEQQQIIAVHVEKLGNLWLHADLLPLLERALAGKLTATHSAVLSPFDPVVWDRKRAEQLFHRRFPPVSRLNPRVYYNKTFVHCKDGRACKTAAGDDAPAAVLSILTPHFRRSRRARSRSRPCRPRHRPSRRCRRAAAPCRRGCPRRNRPR